jgi:hypothetical protein
MVGLVPEMTLDWALFELARRLHMGDRGKQITSQSI